MDARTITGQKMNLKLIRIENYKSIHDTTFRLDNHFSVLVGPNDHGKSNILHAIHDFFTFPITEDGNPERNDAIYRNKKRRNASAAPMRITCLISNLPAGLKHTKRKLDEVAITIQFMANGEVRCSLNSPSLNKARRAHSKAAWEKYYAIRSIFNTIYVPTFRNLEAHLLESDDNAALYNLISTQLLSMLETQQGGTTRAYRTINGINEKIKTLVESSFDDIRSQVARYLPSTTRTDIDFGFLQHIKEDERDKYLSKMIAREVFIKNKTDGAKISELGSGIQQAVLIGLLEKNLIKQGKSNLLLIEEPESFLHPSAQRELFVKLTDLTRKPATQAIFSTHSAAIVDSSPLRSIVAIRKDIEQNTDAIGFNASERKITIKDLNKLEIEKTFQNSELFFSDLIVLVEGRSDQLVLREAIRRLAPELFYRITILDVGGSGSMDVFINFIRSFEFNKKTAFKWLAIFDKDALTGTKALQKCHAKVFPSSASENWNEIEKLAAKNVSCDAYGMINHNSARIFASRINKLLHNSNFIVNRADIEFMLVRPEKLNKAKALLAEIHPSEVATINQILNVDQLAIVLGSKGPNLAWKGTNNRIWKKPAIAKALVANSSADEFPDELKDLILTFKNKLVG